MPPDKCIVALWGSIECGRTATSLLSLAVPKPGVDLFIYHLEPDGVWRSERNGSHPHSFISLLHPLFHSSLFGVCIAYMGMASRNRRELTVRLYTWFASEHDTGVFFVCFCHYIYG